MSIKSLSPITIGNYTLPHADGAAGQVLVTNGSGVVTFATPAASTNNYLTGLSFNTTNGVLTATVSGGSNVTVDLDNRYALTSHTHAYDNYQSWNLKTNGVQRTTVQSGGTLDLVTGSNVALSYGAGGVVTISSTDTNTTYTAGSGLSLTGTVFANTAPNIVQTTVSGNAGSATVLQTARTINGVSFNGSANITVADSTKLPLTGGTLTGALVVPYLNIAEPVENFNPFGQFKMQDGILSNALVGRWDRFDVTIDGTLEPGASIKLSNQNFEEYNQNRLFGTDAGETKVFNINVQRLATGNVDSNGITYSAGYFDLCFYSSPFPASWSARVKNRDGNWTTVTSFTKIGYAKLRGVIPISTYLTDIEFTLTARTSAPYVTGNITYGLAEFELFLGRMAASQGGNISSLGGYLGGTITTSSGITSTNWNTAYSWGNHASAGYTSNTGTVTGVTGTAPIVSSGGTAPAISISAATTGAAGSMSAADKLKLDGIAVGAQSGTVTSVSATAGTGISVTGSPITTSGTLTITNTAPNVTTNLSTTTSATTLTVVSSDGTNAVLPAATTTVAGVLTGANKLKLDGIAAGANAYVLPAATTTALGGIELEDATVQTVAANAVSATASRTYGLQVNSAGQGVINVPWTDNNTVYTHPAYTARSIDTSGAQVIDIFTSDAIGSVTNITTRTLTLADLGYTGATNANYYTLPFVDNSTNWNTAYGWGNHSLAGYTSNTGTVTSIATNSGLTGGTITTSGTIGIASNGVTATHLNVTGNGTTAQYLRSDGDGSFTWATPTDTNTTYTAGAGLTLTGTVFSLTDGSSVTSLTALTGATVVSDIDVDTYGRVTLLATRTLTLANLGYTGATNANYITNNNQLTNGAGYTTYTSNQATNTTSAVTFTTVNTGQGANELYAMNQPVRTSDEVTFDKVNIKRGVIANEENVSVTVGGNHNFISGVPLNYSAAFFDFVIQRGLDLRAGTVMACHDGSHVEYTETSTADLGYTGDVVLFVAIDNNKLTLFADVASDIWEIKVLVRAI